LFFVHHYENYARRRKNNCHRKCFDLIVDINVVREYNQMIAFLHDLIMSDYRDFCRVDDDDNRKFLSKNHRKEDSEFKFIEIFVEDCSVFYFQLL
jgi:hypothetical protein